MSENPRFLHEKYNLGNSEEVEKAANRTEKCSRLSEASASQAGEYLSQKPEGRVQNYIERLKEVIERKDPEKKARGIEALKQILHDKFIIKEEEVPESYYENQRRLAREQGRGDIEITEEMRKQLSEVIIADQKSTLNTWIDYLSSEDAVYPDWLKYYAFRSMLGMGDFNKETHQFNKRSKGTVKPFPDLNRQALAYVLDAIEKKQGEEYKRIQEQIRAERKELRRLKTQGEDTSIIEESIKEKEAKQEVLIFKSTEHTEDDKKLFQSEDFSKLYAWAIEKVIPAQEEQLKTTHGRWVKYEQGSDHMPLADSLQGYGTGWCTAGESTAEAQLKTGDFYVFYSMDKNNRPTIPRVAIRMQENPSTSSGQAIAEVRGIAYEQNLDPYITEVVRDKLKEFPDGSQYEKKTEDMKKLTEIANKFEPISDIQKEIELLEQGKGKLKQDYVYDSGYQELKQELEERLAVNEQIQLTKEELSFLYEMDSQIEGFGYQRDPRIEELRRQRNPELDKLTIFECTEDQIAHNANEINANTKAYVGKLEPGIFDKLQEFDIEHAYTKFPEGKIRRITAEIGGKTEKQLMKELKQAGIKTSGFAKDILNSKNFTTQENQEEINLVRLSVADLGFNEGATTQEIFNKAQALGLELCPPEVGPKYRLQYQNQPMDEWVYIGMKQISDRDGRPDVFSVARDEEGLWLNGRWARPADRWSPDFQFIFRLRPSFAKAKAGKQEGNSET